MDSYLEVLPMKKCQLPMVKLSQEKLLRAVASSTAIETGQSVRLIEAKLKAKSNKFKELSLAL